MRYPLVIFDLDGTVVDTIDPTILAFQEALEPVLGRRPSADEITARFGPADEQILRDWAGEGAAAAAIERLFAAYDREFARRGPYPGVVELLGDLRVAGVKLGLFTGRGRASTDRMFRQMKLDGCFDWTVTGEEPAEPKPAPHGLQMILDLAEVDPEDAVYVGDSPLDGRAARAAGTAWIAATWADHDGPDPGEGADFTVDTVVALREVLLG